MKGSRDAALIAVLYSAGLRRSEVVAVYLADWNEQDNCLIVRSGNGDKDRTNYLDDGAVVALTNWLSWRGNETGALFYPTRKGGKVEGRMTRQCWIFCSGVRRQSLHRSHPMIFAARLPASSFDAGVDIVTVQNLMGHATPVTTARYDRRGKEALA